MRMVRQTAALICCHAVSRGVMIEPALAKEIALDVHVDVEVPLGYQCVNTEALNVRAGPSKETELLFQIQEGQRVEVWGRFDTSDKGIWCFVMWDDGEGGEGWVSADYLSDCPASSEAFHAALEVDTERPPRGKGAWPIMQLWGQRGVPPQCEFEFVESPIPVKQPGRGRLRALVDRCLQAPKRFIDWWTSSPSW